MTSIRNSAVLITGGASGIGKLMGRKCLQLGASHLILWDINPENLQLTTKELRSGYQVQPNQVNVRGVTALTYATLPAMAERGLLPARMFDKIVGRWFKVYTSMNNFTGRPALRAVPANDPHPLNKSTL